MMNMKIIGTIIVMYVIVNQGNIGVVGWSVVTIFSIMCLAIYAIKSTIQEDMYSMMSGDFNYQDDQYQNNQQLSLAQESDKIPNLRNKGFMNTSVMRNLMASPTQQTQLSAYDQAVLKQKSNRTAKALRSQFQIIDGDKK